MLRLTRIILPIGISVLFLGNVEGLEPKSSPRFEEEVIPVPPQQTRSWTAPQTSFPEVFISANSELFEQGLADPRGCEYREIEVVIGSCWRGDAGILTTHGWVLPRGGNSKYQFAVCWNGLVYPVVLVGGTTNLHNDVETFIELDKAMRAQRAKDHPIFPYSRFPEAIPERDSISHESIQPIKASLLIRLGEVDLAKKVWTTWFDGMRHNSNNDQNISDDPYLMLATDWTWALYDRAVCAHMRRDDNLARISARMLITIREIVEKTAADRGFERPYRSHQSEDETFPYFSYLTSVDSLFEDQERRAKKSKILATTESNRSIPALIEDLDQVNARQSGQPGGVDLGHDPRVVSLIKAGDDAIEPLLDCIEHDTRLTRSVHIWRDFKRQRSIIGVHEAAYIALSGILKTSFFDIASTGDDLTSRGQPGRKAIVAQIRAYYERFKNVPLEEQWYQLLATDNLPAKQWLQAAKNITQPTDVTTTPSSMFGGGWTALPNRKSVEKVVLRGAALRNVKYPSVSQLMIKRINELSVEEIESSSGMFNMHNACDMALALAKWDPETAVSVLKQLNERCHQIFEKMWNSNGWTNQRLVNYMSKFAIILARQGDKKVLIDYVSWLRDRKPEDIDDVTSEAFKPIWKFPDDPALAENVDWLFNKSSSPWFPIINPNRNTGMRAYELITSPLIATTAFRKHVLHFLKEKLVAGHLEVKEDERIDIVIKNGWGTTATPYPGDPLVPEPGTKFNIRLCDVYADLISRLEGSPGFEYFWPESKRDKTIKAIATFITQYGGRYTIPDAEWEDEPALVFPTTEKPATKEDVALGRAIFSLEGKGASRLWAMPARPMNAEWPTINVFPRGSSHWDGQTKKMIRNVYQDPQGKVWQAEELFEDGAWKRYYGFVGNYCVIKVPAEEIEFPGGFLWKKLDKGFEYRFFFIDARQKGCLSSETTLNMSDALIVTFQVRNLKGIAQNAPPILNDINDNNDPTFLPGVHIELHLLPAETDTDECSIPIFMGSRLDIDCKEWAEVARNGSKRYLKVGSPKILAPTETVDIFTIDLMDWFDIQQPAPYRLRVSFSETIQGLSQDVRGETIFILEDEIEQLGFSSKSEG
ncbi:hypothetical protein JXQ70_12040 [bacterium]|nr:hypothetical protein [bacterium]